MTRYPNSIRRLPNMRMNFNYARLFERDFYKTTKGQTVGFLIAALTATSVGMVVAFWDLVGTHGVLKRMDENYLDKCYSPDEDWDMHSYSGQQRTGKIFSLIDQFGRRGMETVGSLQESAFCFDITDETVSPSAHWPFRNVFFADEEYPDALAALNFFQPSDDEFWSQSISRPEDINQFTAESALIFSRFTRANRVVQDFKNIYNASDIYGQFANIGNVTWQEFLKTRPEQEAALRVFLETYSKKGEQGAMRAAVQTLMLDADFIAKGDVEFLEAYLKHVSVLKASSYEPIYESFRHDWAFVDVDRDGHKDDAIRLNFRNQVTKYIIDGRDDIRRKVSRKTELVTNPFDTCYDANGEAYTCTTTSWEDVSETVYYKSFPADDTASMTLHPNTMTTIVAYTEVDYMSAQQAEEILGAIEGGTFKFAQPLDSVSIRLMNDIKVQTAANIPVYESYQRPEGLGLK